MKTFRVLLILFLLNCSAIAQTMDTTAYQAPQYPLGKKSFYTYIQRNVIYPPYERENNIQDDVRAVIAIDSSGKIKNVSTSGKDKGLNDIVKNTLIKMPDWTPGKLNGHAIDTSVTQLVYFSIDNERRLKEDTDIVEIVAFKVPLIGNGARYPKMTDQERKSAAAGKIYDRGLAALKNKQYADAVDLFNKALDNGYNSVNLYYNRGVANLNLENKTAACDDWFEAAGKGDREALKIYNDICLKQSIIAKDDTLAKWKSSYAGNTFTWVQQMPAFPGGDQKLLEFIHQHINYASVNLAIKGKVIVRFVVDENGHVRNASIPTGMGLENSCDAAALQVIYDLPDWAPGKQNGHPLAVWQTVSVEFGNYIIQKNDITTNKEVVVPDSLNKSKSGDSEPFTWVQVMPKFPGGDQKMLEYLMSNINYPATAREKGIQGRVTVRFLVNKEGDVENASVPKGMGIGNGCDEEAIRVVMSLPKWEPGTQNGHPVNVWYTAPVIFKLGRGY